MAAMSTGLRDQATSTARRLWRLLERPERRRLIAASLTAMVAGFTANLPAVLLGDLVDAVGAGEAEDGIPVSGLVVFAVVLLAGGLATAVVHNLVHDVTPGVEARLRTAELHKALRQPLGATTETTGTRAAQFNRAAEGAAKLVRLFFVDLVPTVLGCGWAIALACRSSVVLGLVIAGMVPIGFGLVATQLRREHQVRIGLERTRAQLGGMLTEVLGGMLTIRSLGVDQEETARVASVADQAARDEARHHRRMGWFDAIKNLNEQTFAILAVLTALVLVQRGSATPGEILTAFLLYTAAARPLRELHRIVDEVHECVVMTDSMFTLFDEPDDDAFTAPAVRLDLTRPEVIVVCDARRRFADRGVPALAGVSLAVARGEKVAIVGENGSGKSTLVKAMARLEALDRGEVLLGGVPLSSIGVPTLAEHVGYLPQEPFFRAGSIADNIALGRPATPRQVEDAARRAQIHDDIAAMPQGYDTAIGEAGASWSGGQRQRVALARVLLHEVPILILDEATSALDPLSERAVIDLLTSLDDVTVVFVSHRLRTLEAFDRIHVMANGRLVESGTYRELLTRSDVFAGLVAANPSPASTASRAA
jgi:ATP-binding cassette subfamily B protein